MTWPTDWRRSGLPTSGGLNGCLKSSPAPEPLCVDQLSERMYSRQRGYPALLALTDVVARVEYLEQLGRIGIADIEHLAEQACPVFRYCPA